MREVKFNVLSHEVNAAKGSNGHPFPLQEIRQEPRTFWERMVASLPSPEVLDVAGRAVKGFVVPHWAAGVILAAILSGGASMYWSMSGQIAEQGKVINSQNELLIRMDQRFIEKEKYEAKEKEILEKRLQNIDAVQIALGRDIVKAQKGN